MCFVKILIVLLHSLFFVSYSEFVGWLYFKKYLVNLLNFIYVLWIFMVGSGSGQFDRIRPKGSDPTGFGSGSATLLKSINKENLPVFAIFYFTQSYRTVPLLLPVQYRIFSPKNYKWKFYLSALSFLLDPDPQHWFFGSGSWIWIQDTGRYLPFLADQKLYFLLIMKRKM